MKMKKSMNKLNYAHLTNVVYPMATELGGVVLDNIFYRGEKEVKN